VQSASRNVGADLGALAVMQWFSSWALALDLKNRGLNTPTNIKSLSNTVLAALVGVAIGKGVHDVQAQLEDQSIRKSNIVGRWGGEEFLIICPDTDLQGCETLAEQIRKRIAEHEFAEKRVLNASLGVAVHQQDENADTMIARVDKALYRAKKHGRNRVEVDRGGQAPASRK